MKTNRNLRFAVTLFTDILIFGVCLVVFALFHHVIPYRISIEEGIVPPPAVISDFSQKFADKFVTEGTVEKTDSSYKTSNVSIEIKTMEYADSVCHVAEIYVKNSSVIKTAFANNTFGKTITDSTISMANENNAVFAVSGDYYGIRDRSVVIRNGMIYRTKKAHDVCVLFYDGTVKTYEYADFNALDAINHGAWQVWDFGPVLLKNSQKISDFDSGIEGKNPRMAFGYYEPGHYVFVAADGRQDNSKGLSLEELSAFFEILGCKEAYNLDGGHSAVMTFGSEIINSPSKKGGREISDIIYIESEG